MNRFLAMVGRHGRAMTLGSVVAAFVIIGGGLALGMSTAAGSPAPLDLPAAGLVNAVTLPSRHYLVGTVAEVVAPQVAVVRGTGGRFFVVEYDASTVVKRDRQRAPIQALRRGTRVIILGSPRDGRFHADIVTVTGTARVRQLPVPSPATTPRPFVTPTRTPAPAPTRP